MIGIFIRYILFDYCLDKLEKIIDSNMDVTKFDDEFYEQEWSVDIGERFKTIVTMSNGIDCVYHNCKIIDNEYMGNGWRIMVMYDNFTEPKKYVWISYQEIYKMIR